MRICFVATLLLLFLTPPPVHAADSTLSAAELHKMCTSASDLDYGFCAGFVTSVAHVMLTQKIGLYQACHHQNVRSQQLIDTFNTWAEHFPDQLNHRAETATAAAFARAFPCIKKP